MKEYLVEVFVQAGDGSIRDSFARQRIEVKVRAYDNQGHIRRLRPCSLQQKKSA